MSSHDKTYDAVIIGSGFGGTLIAHALVRAGWKVLMLERGDWVNRGPENWGTQGSVDLTEHYDHDSPYHVVEGGNKEYMGIYASVGGPSVFYGGVSFRFREQDFTPPEEIVDDSGAHWPISYDDLEPFYSQAEVILGVAGQTGADPTEPWRSAAYPQKPRPLSDISQKLKQAARNLGLNPFTLPLAINYDDKATQRQACVACTTCDTFACAVEAKNDLATVVLPHLIEKGLELYPKTVVTELAVTGSRIDHIECYDKRAGEVRQVRARTVVLSAGAIASPHLLLASKLDALNPGADTIGRYLMRHVNAIVFGIFPGQADKQGIFHKQIGIHDFYFGHSSIDYPKGKIGTMQQVQTPPAALVENELPGLLGKVLSPAVRLLTGLLVIAEDKPQFANHLAINWKKTDRFGLPEGVIRHRYAARDLAAAKALKRKAKAIMRKAGAMGCYVHNIRTFSHSVGTLRMGSDPQSSVLDSHCQFRGIDNLYVVDGSFMPTSAGLNPSLTIAANALRVGDHLVKRA